jgi:hypothetical protein
MQWEYPLELGLWLCPFFSPGMKDKWKYMASVKIVIIGLKPKYAWIKYCRCNTIHYKDRTDSPGSKPGHPKWETAHTVGRLHTVHNVPNFTCAYYSSLRVMFMEWRNLLRYRANGRLSWFMWPLWSQSPVLVELEYTYICMYVCMYVRMYVCIYYLWKINIRFGFIRLNLGIILRCIL